MIAKCRFQKSENQDLPSEYIHPSTSVECVIYWFCFCHELTELIMHTDPNPVSAPVSVARSDVQIHSSSVGFLFVFTYRVHSLPFLGPLVRRGGGDDSTFAPAFEVHPGRDCRLETNTTHEILSCISMLTEQPINHTVTISFNTCTCDASRGLTFQLCQNRDMQCSGSPSL